MSPVIEKKCSEPAELQIKENRRIVSLATGSVVVRVCPRVEPSDRRTEVDPRDRMPFVGLDL